MLAPQDYTKVYKVDVPQMSEKWIAYRVRMCNDLKRKWTLAMCEIVKNYNQPGYKT